MTTRKYLFAALVVLGMLGSGLTFAQRTDNNLAVLQNTGTYSESFENLAAWGNVYTNVFITNGWYTSDSTLDKSAIAKRSYTFDAASICGYPLPSAPGTNVLALNTNGSILSNSFGSGFDMSGGITYIDTMVQFVSASDSNAPAACTTSDSGIKAAVYINTSSNLAIYHGTLVASGENQGAYATNMVDAISAVTFATGTWCRLTIAYDATVTHYENGAFPTFQVLTNGIVVTNANAYTAQQKIDWAAGTLPSGTDPNGTWFRAATDIPAARKYLAALGFQGDGAIDNLVVSTTPPLFAPYNPGDTYFWLTVVNNGNGSSDFGGTNGLTQVQVLQGTMTNIVYTANQWFAIASLTSNGSSVPAAANALTYTQTLTVNSAISNVVTFYQPTNYVTSTLLTNVAGASGSADHVGQVPVLNGNNLTITYTADTYSYISNVSSNGTSLGAQGSPFALTLGPVVDNSMTAVGAFSRDSHNITQTVGANGSANPAGSPISVLNGATTSIVYTASQFYRINTILTNGTPVAGAGGQQSLPVSIGPVLADMTVNASFYNPTSAVTWTLGLLGLQPAGGPASTVYNVPNGGTASIIVTAEQWSVISDVNSNGTQVAGGPFGQSYTLNLGPVDGAMTGSATVYRAGWNILQVIGSNGTADPSNTLFQVPNGMTTQIVYAATSTWYTINQLLTNGAVVAAANQMLIFTQELFQVQGAYSNNVSFYRAPHTISLIGGLVNGYATPALPITVLNGDSTSVLFTADDWYRVASVSPNGTPGFKTATATFATVLADTTASATFITNNTGAVVANVPSFWALEYPGLTEAYAIAHSNSVEQAYMLNLNPLGIVTPSLAISGIGVSGSSVNVTVVLDNNSSPTNVTIYGTLQLLATANLTNSFVVVASTELPGASFTNNGRHVVTFTDVNPTKFYKAEITLP